MKLSELDKTFWTFFFVGVGIGVLCLILAAAVEIFD